MLGDAPSDVQRCLFPYCTWTVLPWLGPQTVPATPAAIGSPWIRVMKDRKPINNQKKKTTTYLFLMKLSTFEGSPKELGGKHCMLFSVRRNAVVLMNVMKYQKTHLEL